MDFYDVLDQVLELLQQQGRVTCGGLKLHLQLEDETLAALKEDLLHSQPRVFVSFPPTDTVLE
jgi:hypothetical protein